MSTIDLGSNVGDAPSGAAGGDLGGTYPNPSVVAFTGNLPTSNLAGGVGASVSTFWRGDGSWGIPGVSGSISLTTQVSGVLPAANTSTLNLLLGSISLSGQTSGSLALSQTTGSLSLVDRVSGSLALSQTSGSISLTAQVSGILPAAQVGVIDVTSGTSGSVSLTNKVSGSLALTQTSGSISLTSQVSGTLPAAQVGIIDVTGGTSGSVSLTNKVSGDLPLAQTSGSISLTSQVVGTLSVAQGGTGTSGFTQGSVVFVDVAGTYAQNNSSLFWDNTTQSLGLGTSTISVGATLDVVGSGTTSSLIIPRGTLANRPPTGVNGMMRYNTTNSCVEFYSSSSWGQSAKFVASGVIASNTSNIGSTFAFMARENCFYRASGTRWITRRASTSCNAPLVAVAFTDPVTNIVVGAGFVPPNTTNSVTTYDFGVATFYAKANTPIHILTNGYQSSGSVSMMYWMKFTLEELPLADYTGG